MCFLQPPHPSLLPPPPTSSAILATLLLALNPQTLSRAHRSNSLVPTRSLPPKLSSHPLHSPAPRHPFLYPSFYAGTVYAEPEDAGDRKFRSRRFAPR